MQSHNQERRPNIVFVFSDQHRARTTGFSGAQVHTPVMDRMAAEGVVFDTAVSNIPVCTPWRAALLTGQYPLSNGLFLNDLRLPTDRPTLGTILGAAGYATAYIGKWHLDGNRRDAFTPPGPRRQGFQFWAVGNCTHDYRNSLYYRDSPEPRYWDGYDAAAQTGMAIDYLKARDRNRPFALVLSWGPPHNPYRDLPQRYLERYPSGRGRGAPQLPRSGARGSVGILRPRHRPGRATGSPGSGPRRRGAAAGHHFRVHLGPRRHARLAGSAAQAAPLGRVDPGALPAALSRPGRPRQPHLVSRSTWSTSCPTLLGLAGVPIPATVEGRDLSPAVRGEPFTGNESAFTMCIAPFAEYVGAPWRGVRTERYSYARWLDGRGILYDTLADPDQLENRYLQSDWRGLRGDLEDVLAATPGAARRPLPPRRRLPGTVRLRRRRARRHSPHELTKHRRGPRQHCARAHRLPLRLLLCCAAGVVACCSRSTAWSREGGGNRMLRLCRNDIGTIISDFLLVVVDPRIRFGKAVGT